MSESQNTSNGHDSRLDRIEKLVEENAEQIRSMAAQNQDFSEHIRSMAAQNQNLSEQIQDLSEQIRGVFAYNQDLSQQVHEVSAQSRDFLQSLRLTRDEAAQERERLNALIEFQFAFKDDFEAFKKETLRSQVLAADEFRTSDEKLSKKIADVSAELKELGRTTDRRIAEVISAIGQLLSRLPPPPPAN